MKYCRKCGNQLADEAKFCVHCGTAVVEAKAPTPPPAEPKKPEVKAETQPVTRAAKEPFLANPIFLGILFVAAGVLMLFLPIVGGKMFDTAAVAQYGVSYLAATSAIASFFTVTENLAFQAPALIAIVTGIVLLQKRRGAFKTAMAGAIFQLIAAIMSLLILLMAMVMAPTIMQMYVYDPEVTSVGVQMMRSRGLTHCMVVELPILLIGIATFVFTLIARGKARLVLNKAELFDRMPRSAAALIVLIPFVSVLLMVKNLLGTLMAGQYFGTNMLAAYSMASSAIATYTMPVLTLITLLIVYCMIAHKWKYWIVSVSGLGALLLYGIVIILLVLSKGRQWLVIMNTPAEIMSYAQSMLLPHTLAQMLFPLALFFWIAASARGSIAAWLQPILAVIILILYIIFEVMFAVGLQLGTTIPLGVYVISLMIFAFSIPLGIFCKPKKE